MSSPPKLLKYDEDGDLILYVDEDSARYQVCSRTLARSSRVFKRMLRGGFSESCPVDGSDWIVELPDDKSEPMQIFLSIIHGRFNEVPKTLSITSLHSLLVLTEKYDATEALQLWAARWMENIDKRTEDHSIIGIAWELGQIELFQQLMERITERCTLDASGCPLFGGREELSNENGVYDEGEHKLPLVLNYLEPTRIIDTITKNRQLLLEAELKPYLKLYSAVRVGRCVYQHENGVSVGDDGWACDSMVFGSLVKGFAKHNINLALPNAIASYSGDVYSFRELLTTIRLTSPHEECQWDLEQEEHLGREQAMTARAALKFVTQDQMKYLNGQAKKLGFPVKIAKRKATRR